MTVQHIEKELMKLDTNSRAKLASVLLSSLNNLTDEEHEKLWAEESLRRHNDLLKGKAISKSADAVFKNVRTRLK